MRTETEIRERIEDYREMQEQVATGDTISGDEERYAIRILELEWVLESSE